MRALRHRTFVPVAAVAASTALFACHRGDSILLVEVAGDLRLEPASFQVAVEPAQAAERTFEVAPKNGSTVTLPTSLSIEMAPALTGPVTVTVTAFDVRGYMLAYGSTTQTDINVGGQTIVVVTLISNLPPPVDAGMDAVPGAGGSLDASGSGGAAGAGVAGSDGAGAGGNTGMAGRAGSGGAGGVTGSGGKGGAGGSIGAGGTGGSGGTIGSGGADGMGGRGTGGSAAGGAPGSGGVVDAGGATDSRGDV